MSTMRYFIYVSEIFKKSPIIEVTELDPNFHVVKDYHEVLIVESGNGDIVKN